MSREENGGEGIPFLALFPLPPIERSDTSNYKKKVVVGVSQIRSCYFFKELFFFLPSVLKFCMIAMKDRRSTRRDQRSVGSALTAASMSLSASPSASYATRTTRSARSASFSCCACSEIKDQRSVSKERIEWAESVTVDHIAAQGIFSRVKGRGTAQERKKTNHGDHHSRWDEEGRVRREWRVEEKEWNSCRRQIFL